MAGTNNPTGTGLDLSQLPPWLQQFLGGSKSPTPTSTSQVISPDGQFYWNGSNWTPLPKYLQDVAAGGSVASVAQNYHLNPQELALEYAKLQNSLTTQQMSDLKDLITNRNTESVNLANVYDTAAKNAADFAANPRDSVADLMYRKAVGLNGQQATPYGSISNSQFGQYGNALADKMQAMFGPAADALKRAGEFVGSIPPSEYLAPPQTPAPAGASTGGGGGGGSTPPPAPASSPPPPASNAPQGSGPLGYGPVPGMSHGGNVIVRPQIGHTMGGNHMVGATTSEGGLNMNVPEPARIVGQSGHVYATLAEHAPEQVIVKPLPSAQKAQKDNEAFMKQTAGAKRYDAGGAITFGTDPSQFMDQLRQQFGMRGINTASGSALPDPRLLAGTAGTDLLADPLMKSYAQAGYSALGIDPNELDYTINRFSPAGIRPELPKVTF